mgnify:CR=1 FL=1
MPASIPGALANLAVLSLGKTLVNLNYTASPTAFAHMLQAAEISCVISSTQFLSKLRSRGINIDLYLAGKELIELENLKSEISGFLKFKYFFLAVLLPARVLKYFVLNHLKNNTPAAILFSSGSEGLPKGVLLSHRNILANARQSACVLSVQSSDSVLGILPLFHAFGLTVTTLMPVLVGTPVIFYPDPTDAKGVAKAIATYDVTVLCGTSTFLNMYVRHPKVSSLMFQSLRSLPLNNWIHPFCACTLTVAMQQRINNK